ncbi:putative peptide zinc metalloprotease protein [Catenulispora sp. EB89]|uniref:hypothetical protein n=1 Tax=Catenulispora sp. EB89 TaxID=3156257 RepID=UPI0035183017
MTAGPDSVVTFHELVTRREDGEWIVGRAATGEFVELPEEAKTIIDLLAEGRTVAEAKREADRRHEDDLDVVDFVADLVELGFVAAVGGRDRDRHGGGPGPATAPRQASLAWLRPGHVRWVFTPRVGLAVTAFIIAGLVQGVRHEVLPTYHSFFALSHPGLNALIAVVLVWSNVALHEFWHLAAARAAGVDARIGFGTRLTFLVAQTSAPGLWAAERRARMRFHLAGMASDLTVVAGCLLVASSTAASSLPHRLAELLTLSVLFSFLAQFAIYMRTDVYLVVQELTRCKNLYGDAMARIRWYVTRIRARRGGDQSAGAGLGVGVGVGVGPDPVLAIPRREQRTVRVYTVAVVIGTVLTLAQFAVLQLPIVAMTVYRSAKELAASLSAGSLPQAADGTLVFAVVVGAQVLFVRTLVHQRRLGAQAG